MVSDKSYATEQRLDALINWGSSWPLITYSPSPLTTESVIASFGPIPAHDAEPNTAGGQPGGYRVRIRGVAGSPNGQLLTVNAYVNGLNTPGGAHVAGSGVLGTTAAFGARNWWLEFCFYLQTTGTSGQLNSAGTWADDLTSASAPGAPLLNNLVPFGVSGTGVEVNTANAIYVPVTALFANTSGSNSITAMAGSMERVGRW